MSHGGNDGSIDTGIGISVHEQSPVVNILEHSGNRFPSSFSSHAGCLGKGCFHNGLDQMRNVGNLVRRIGDLVGSLQRSKGIGSKGIQVGKMVDGM